MPSIKIDFYKMIFMQVSSPEGEEQGEVSFFQDYLERLNCMLCHTFYA